jgi:hypothetical protein
MKITTKQELSWLVASQPALRPNHKVWSMVDEYKLDRLISEWALDDGDECAGPIDELQELKNLLNTWDPVVDANDALDLWVRADLYDLVHERRAPEVPESPKRWIASKDCGGPLNEYKDGGWYDDPLVAICCTALCSINVDFKLELEE